MSDWKNNRPKDWDIYRKEQIDLWFKKTGSGTFSVPHFEAGADAMYRPAYRKGIKETLEWCKKRHYLVDYDLDKFIAQLEEGNG